MALRRKHDLLAALRPDIAVVQECEEPSRLGETGATGIAWCGDNSHEDHT